MFHNFRFSIRVVLIFTVCFLPVPSIAFDRDICSELFAKEAKQQAENLKSWVSSLFNFSNDSENIASIKVPEASKLIDPKYWVTVKEGTAFSIDCQTGVTGSVYYPLGLILAQVHHLGPISDENSQASFLFMTEYGLHVVLDELAVAPIRKDDVFYFADGVGIYNFCINSVEANPNCDAMLPNNDLASGLSSKSGYIHGSFNKSDDAKTIKRRIQEFQRWSRLYANQNRGLPVTENTITREEMEFICERYGAGTFYRKGAPLPENIGYQWISLSLCAYTDLEKRSGFSRKPLKIVTYDQTVRIFKDGWSSMFFKRIENIHPIIGLIEDVKKFANGFRSRKECRGELKTENFQTVGFSAGAKTPGAGGILSWLSIGGEFEIKMKSTFQETFKEGEMFIISAHIFRTGKKNGEGGLIPLLDINDIWLVMKCEDDRPIKAKYIVIYHPEVIDGWIKIYIEDLRETYDDRTNKYGGPSWSEEKRNLYNGVIWQITDYQQYFYWRSVLRRFLCEDAKIQDLLLRYPEEREDQIIDYFVHLTMAATFQSLI